MGRALSGELFCTRTGLVADTFEQVPIRVLYKCTKSIDYAINKKVRVQIESGGHCFKMVKLTNPLYTGVTFH